MPYGQARAARRPQARPPYGAPQVSSPGPPAAVSERLYGPCGVSGCPFVLFGVKQPVLGSQTTGRRGPGPAAPPQAQGGPGGPLSCCARSACTAFGAGRDPTGRNRPIGYFSPPKTTPKPPGTTIFGRLYTNMKQSCNNHALIMHQSCSNHALSCNNHALIMH